MHIFKQFFSYDFLIYLNRIRIEKIDIVFASIAVGLLVLGIIVRIVSWRSSHKVRKSMLLRFARLFVTIGIMGLVWYGARYQLVAWFGTHLTYVIILLIGLVWTGFLLRYVFGSYFSEKQAWEKEQQKLKYIK